MEAPTVVVTEDSMNALAGQLTNMALQLTVLAAETAKLREVIVNTVQQKPGGLA